MKIKFNYLIITSENSTLRSFFFFLLKKTPFRFKLKSKFMNLGGPAYKGWAFQAGLDGKFFIVQRPRLRIQKYEHIMTLPGSI